MVKFEDLMNELTEEELKQGYNDILIWRKTGVVSNESIIRNIHENYNKQSNIEFPFYGMEQIWLTEIAIRYYKK